MKEVKGKNFVLINADAKDLPKNDFADLIVTDPPYLLTSGGNGQPKYDGHIKMKGGWAKDYNNDGRVVDCDITWQEIADICFAALRSGRHLYTMCNNRNVQDMLNAHEQAGFKFHNLLVWDKRTATPNKYYMKNLEFTGFFYKKRTFTIHNPSSKQLLTVSHKDEPSLYSKNNKSHPTEKPVSLMQHYIKNSSYKSDCVFDPFAGSASTGVAAISCGRKFLGVEKDKDFFEMAVERLRATEKNMQGVLL